MVNLTDPLKDIEEKAASMGVSMERLCRHAGVSPSTISHWKRERSSPSFRVYRAIMAVDPAVAPELRQRKPYTFRKKRKPYKPRVDRGKRHNYPKSRKQRSDKGVPRGARHRS